MASVQQFVIGALIFVTIFAGIMIVFGDMVSVYNLAPDQLYFGEDTSDQSGKVFNLTRQVSSQFKTSKTDTDNLDAGVVGGFNALETTWSLYGILRETLGTIAVALQIPLWLLNSILTGLLITFTLAIISAFLGRNL